MRNYKALYIKLLLVAWSASSALTSVVTTAQGQLRGEVHHGFTSYRGIPYAGVTDAGRFKRAGLAPTWSGIRESQQSRWSRSSRPDECLTLDVHVPAVGTAWPVLAWVRGGSGQFTPGKLVQQGIVVVIISHRIGPLGFLCLDDEKMPGNAGVKDVVLALRWVRDNISAFQGNPYKVVVGGQGFAAAMVETLLLTPMAQDLFHGAIMQSGSVLCPWAFNYDASERGLMLGQALDEAHDESVAIMDANVEVLAEKSYIMTVSYFPFAMCIEKGFKHEERLLSEAPMRLLLNKFTRKVPIIIGYNSDEAYIFLSLLRQKSLRKRMARDLSMLLPEELKFFNENELKNVVKQIQNSYFKKDNFSFAALLEYHRDAYFSSHIHRSVRLHGASPHPVYYYRFSYAGSPGVHEDHEVAKTGAAHADELAYLFPESARDMDGEEGVVQQHFIRLWTNFVKHQVPTPPGESPPHWEPADASGPRLLDITERLAMKDAPSRVGVWEDIYDRFYYERNPGGF